MQDSSVLRAIDGESRSSNDALQHEEKPASSKMSQTLGNLDALLGIEEEKKAEPEEKPTGDNVRHNYDCYYCYTRPLGDVELGAIPKFTWTYLCSCDSSQVPCVQVQQMNVGVSNEVLKQIAEAEAKKAGRDASPQSLKDIEKQMVHIPALPMFPCMYLR